MQDLLIEMLWTNEEIPEQAERLCRELPGFDTARQAYYDIAQRIQAMVGYDLYNRFQEQFLHYTSYEVRAYYALGLGLREALFRELCV